MTLAVVAVPRHASIAEQARRTDVATLARGIDSAADLAYTLWQVSGEPDAINTDRGRIRLIHGYPDSASLMVLLEQSETMPFEFNGIHWQHRDSTADSGCRVSYKPPAEAGQLPLITVDDADC